MDHIKYSKNVLDPERFRDLKDLCTKHINEIPTYNFCRKTEESSNYLEEIIRHLIGRDNHVEYWVRDNLHPTLFHVDGNELEQKIDSIKYGGVDPDSNIQFPLNTHVLYVNIHPKMKGGDLHILPYNTYVKGRAILDTSYEPLEKSPIITIKPVENNMVLWTKPIYHAISEVINTDVVKNRISFMFSSWGTVPKVYEKHEHWSNYNNDFIARTQHAPKPMEFNLK